MQRKLDINTHIHYIIYIAVYADIAPQQSIHRTYLLADYRGYRRVRDCITTAAAGYHLGYHFPSGPMVLSNHFQTQHLQTALLPYCTSDLTVARHLRPAEHVAKMTRCLTAPRSLQLLQ